MRIQILSFAVVTMALNPAFANRAEGLKAEQSAEVALAQPDGAEKTVEQKILFNFATQEACIANPEANVEGKFKACNEDQLAQFNDLAVHSIREGDKTAGLGTLGAYYLICTAVNGATLGLIAADVSLRSGPNGGVLATAALGAGVVSATVCLPATGLNLGILYLIQGTRNALDQKPGVVEVKGGGARRVLPPL